MTTTTTTTPPPPSEPLSPSPHDAATHNDVSHTNNTNKMADPGGYVNREYASASAPRPSSYTPNLSIVPTEFHVRNGASTHGGGSGAGGGGGGADVDTPPPDHPSRFHEELTSHRGSSSQVDSSRPVADDGPPPPPRTDSQLSMSSSHAAAGGLPSRSGSTLKKKASLTKKASLRRGGSRKGSRAGSVRSVNLGDKEKYSASDDEANSAFYVPIPTSGNPTDVLVNRFQAWRKVIKDLINVFRDVQRSYESRAKMLLSASQSMGNVTMPATFLISGGISDATDILKDFHRRALSESNKAKEVEAEIVTQLNGLRNDLQHKTKEIKGLSGDFKNSVDKEVDATRKHVRQLHESLGLVDSDAAATSGKGDPFVIKLGVDRQLEKQMEEENYLHNAYLNLEKSGRELESIVVGEIQKAYNAYASILKRDADTAYDTVDRLRDGPISMPKNHEWEAFVSQTEHLIDPNLPVRSVDHVSYPGKDHPAAAEVRSGMLERKSKYLRSYTPGWYVLSPTHLHEFKSADRITSQSLVMSLYLPEQKLGSHSQQESSSHKFILKGRQTGAMHRGHAWVFRAESHDTMMAWYEDIKNLTEKTGEARNAFVRRHAPSLSGSFRASIDSERALDEDEADAAPFMADRYALSAQQQRADIAAGDEHWQRPQPGGRFPSDIQPDRRIQSPNSPSSGKNTDHRRSVSSRTHAHPTGGAEEQIPNAGTNMPDGYYVQPAAPASGVGGSISPEGGWRHSRNYGEWMTPLAPTSQRRHTSDHRHHQQQDQQQHQQHSVINDHDHAVYSPPANERFHSVASSTGAPVIVPDTDDRPYRSPAEATDTDPSPSYPAKTPTKAISRSDSTAANADHHHYLQQQQGEIPTSEDGSPPPISHKPSSSSRKSTASEVRVPGQFPATTDK